MAASRMVMPAGDSPSHHATSKRSGWALSAVLASALLVLGGVEGGSELWHPAQAATVAIDLLYGFCTAGLVFWGARVDLLPRQVSPSGVMMGATLVLAFVVPLLLAHLVLRSFPVSADEYGYTYLADTLHLGRLWNAPVQAELRDVLETFYIPDQDGKRLSQYPPGWPAVLALFGVVGLRPAANPALGLLSAALLALGLRELRVEASRRVALVALVTLAPFTTFNNASLFNHPMAGACVLAIAFLDLRNERRPALWMQLGIGFAFSVLLTTRYEAFLIAFGLYVADGVWRRRPGLLGRWFWAAAGAVPVTALFGFYNWRITGSPFTTTLAWGFPDLSYGLHGQGIDGISTPALAAVRTGRFVTWWAEFASVAVLPFAALGLWRRLRLGCVRWFDLFLPAVIAFFVFYPDGGGFQYGPRHWFVGWLTLPLTIGAAFPSMTPWPLGRWRFSPGRLVLLQIAAYAGFTATYAVFAGLQAAARQESLRVADAAPPPPLVLMPTSQIRLVPWQVRPIPLDAKDLTRNAPDGFGAPVVYGRDLGAARTALLCDQVQGRSVWRVLLQGSPPRGKLAPACRDGDG